MCSAGSAAVTTALLARGGNTPAIPRPFAWWQLAQLLAYNAAPLASPSSDAIPLSAVVRADTAAVTSVTLVDPTGGDQAESP